jgi:L-rhamnose mutarotase
MLGHHLACQCQACLEASLDEDMNNYYAELHEEVYEEMLSINKYNCDNSEWDLEEDLLP